ncbi:unnamed protein product [Brassica napus]|uniref:(rape) hypothetical protein n=1 Tax=Brassica napus TaxID=3708 RepID=A0A816Y4X8_BRANA|nr:unnamed protein product [Brassica napus]
MFSSSRTKLWYNWILDVILFGSFFGISLFTPISVTKICELGGDVSSFGPLGTFLFIPISAMENNEKGGDLTLLGPFLGISLLKPTSATGNTGVGGDVILLGPLGTFLIISSFETVFDTS